MEMATDPRQLVEESEAEADKMSALPSDWSPEQEARIEFFQETARCTRMQAIRKMRQEAASGVLHPQGAVDGKMPAGSPGEHKPDAGSDDAEHTSDDARIVRSEGGEYPLSDEDNAFLDEFERLAKGFGTRVAEGLSIIEKTEREMLAFHVRLHGIFSAKPRGTTVRGCSTLEKYYGVHVGESYRNARRKLAAADKTLKKFANKPKPATPAPPKQPEQTEWCSFPITGAEHDEVKRILGLITKYDAGGFYSWKIRAAKEVFSLENATLKVNVANAFRTNHCLYGDIAALCDHVSLEKNLPALHKRLAAFQTAGAARARALDAASRNVSSCLHEMEKSPLLDQRQVAEAKGRLDEFLAALQAIRLPSEM
jgi:hypothetical protein